MIDLPDLPPNTVVALDTETSGLHPDDGARVAAVSVAYRHNGELVAQAWPFDQGVRDKLAVAQASLLELDDPNLGPDQWDQLLAWLEDKRLLFHNAKFDLMMMATGTRHYGGTDLIDQYYWDTMVVQRLLDPLEPVNLGASARRRLGTDSKAETEAGLKAAMKAQKVNRYDLVPWEAIQDYAANDAELTYLLWEDQQARIDDGECHVEWVDLELNLTWVLYLLEQRGLGYDADSSLDAANILAARADQIEKSLPFPATPNGAKDWFYRQQGMVPTKVTAKGAPSLDDEAVLQLVESGVRWAAEYAEASKLRRAVSMWYAGYPQMIGADGRLRTQYRQVKVVSGRMSVERVQLQAIPKYDKAYDGVPHIREFFHAKPGHELWNLDLSQAELRVAAHFSRCTRMLEMLEEGADLHSITCAEVIGTTPDDPNFKRDRDIAKRLTFGGIFQIGARKFQATLSKLANIHLPLGECERIVNNWRRMYPEYGRIYRQAERAVRERGYVRLFDGRPSFFGPRDYPNTGWNRMVQGSLAEFLKYWLIFVEERWPGFTVLTVHDSVVLEIPTGEASTVAHEVGQQSAALATELFGCEMKVDVGPWN